MVAITHVQNIAIVGASGNLGSLILKALLSADRFKITVISRESSTATFPTDASITVLKGDYDSSSFLGSSFSGQDALVLVLNPAAVGQPQIKLIEAAATAGVKWILPTEYGTDSANEEITKYVPVNSMKIAPRLRLEELVKTNEGVHWIGIVTGLWFDYCLTAGFFKINIPTRSATLLDGGVGQFNTTLLSTVALAVTRLLSLPEMSSSGPSLCDFADKFCYVSSFLTSQRAVLDALQRVTGTAEADWTVEDIAADEYIEDGKARLAKGEMGGMVKILGGMVFKGGMGGDYESVKGISNEALGLPAIGLDQAIEEILENGAKAS